MQTGYSTAVETGTSGVLRSRFHNIVADVDIASILAPGGNRSMPNGIGSLPKPRKRTRIRKRGTNRLIALQTSPLQSDTSDLGPRTKWSIRISRKVSQLGKSNMAPKRDRVFERLENRLVNGQFCLFVSLLAIWRHKSPFSIFSSPNREQSSARIDGFDLNTKHVNALNPLLARILGKVPPRMTVYDVLAQLPREDVQLLFSTLNPPRPMGDFFLHGLHGDHFTLPNHIAHSLRIELAWRGFKGEIASMTERELFLVDVLFPGARLPRKRYSSTFPPIFRYWERRRRFEFLKVEAFKCVYTDNMRRHQVNSCSGCSSSFALWSAKLERGPTSYQQTLRIAVNVPTNQWNLKKLY